MMEYLDQAEQAKLRALRDKNPFVDEALRQVDRIMSSAPFARLQDKTRGILGFGVAKKLLGEEIQVKEISIARCVYKDNDYDPAVDNKIRVAGLDLRKKLLAYAEGEGRNDPFQILLPDGTFVPDLRDRRMAISVMRFENWNPNGDQDHFCDLIRDEILSGLSHAGSIRVSRDSLPGESGNRHRYLLRGSLECPDNALKLNMSLSDTDTGRILDTGSFEGRRDDLLRLPGRVVEASLKALQPEAGALAAIAFPRSREKFEAVQLYRQGRWHLRRRTAPDIRRAIDLFQQAIEANSEYAAAYSGLADCHLILSWYELTTPDRVWFEIAKDHALTAVALNPGLPEARTSLAYARLLCDFDWAGAEQEFGRAIRIENRCAPAHHWYANLLVMQGRFGEAEEEMKRAVHLDPASIVIRKTMGDPWYYARQFDRAIEAYTTALKINSNFWMALLFRGWCYQQMGDMAPAQSEFEAAAATGGMSSVVQGALGHLYATSGRQDQALLLLRQIEERSGAPYVAPHTQAAIYAGLGDKDRAFERLDASFEDRIELLAWIKVDPRFDMLRSDPRFDLFLERLGLTSNGT